jgi:mannose/cellobiose epimerase-like protein (N-acyl-D-glucosamine 2-epimerase family)
MMSQLNEQSEKFQHWCSAFALPLWAKNAFDINGGFHEQLNLDGTPDLLHSRRVRVQARTAYVYAHAHDKKWYNDATIPANHAWNYVMSNGLQGGECILGDNFKGCAHLLNADGTLLDGYRDTYAQAFIMLAAAWRYQAFGDKRALQIADETLDFLDTHLKADNGGWYEGLPQLSSQAVPRRQNPHMHLFEALLALFEVTKNEKYMARAHSIFGLFEAHFFHKELGVVLEFFDNDWSLYDGVGAIEPGHMMEWCWLLRYYEKLSGKNVSQYADRLFDNALKYGLNSELGLICDTVNIAQANTEPSYRTWPQTEYIKASVAQARAGREGMEGRAANAITSLFKYYLDTQIKGGWIDQVDVSGRAITNVMPTSTFYHLFCAASEVANYKNEEE